MPRHQADWQGVGFLYAFQAIDLDVLAHAFDRLGGIEPAGHDLFEQILTPLVEGAEDVVGGNRVHRAAERIAQRAPPIVLAAADRRWARGSACCSRFVSMMINAARSAERCWRSAGGSGQDSLIVQARS